MFDRFSADIRYLLLGMFDVIAGPGSTSPMFEALQWKRYEVFALHYNGNDKAAKYGACIEQFHDAFQSHEHSP